MEEKEIRALLIRYTEGKCTDEEKYLVETAYLKDNISYTSELNKQQITEDIQEVFYLLPKPVKQVRLWPRIAVAAAAVIATTLGVWLYYASSPSTLSSRASRDLVANDIAPGHNTATLTLANGKTIHLDTSKTSVTVTDSVKIATTLTASTPRGGTYQVVLPDGTKAWLNAASSIRFPSSFAGNKQRRIEMTGEVYLEVAKDKSHPFIVNAGGQQVEVLGTHFNVNAYADEGSVKTTLLEGSVLVRHFDDRRDLLNSTGKRSLGTLEMTAKSRDDDRLKANESIVLKPNQQAILINNKTIKVQSVNAEDAVAWKDGLFVFEDEPLEQIMRRIERWYNVQIVYDQGVSKTKRYWGSVSRYEQASSVLDVLQSTKNIHFKIEGRRIWVMK